LIAFGKPDEIAPRSHNLYGNLSLGM
jgi:hypothetical protein